MKTSNKLYEVYDALIGDAKSSIRELVDKSVKKEVVFSSPKPEILIEGWGGAEKVSIEKISMKDGFLDVYSDGDKLKNDIIHSSEWIYILECIEYGLNE